MGLGIHRSFISAADIVITNSIVLVTTSLVSAIAASETQFLKWWVPFTVGATGGFRSKIVSPAGSIVSLASCVLHNTVNDVLIADTQVPGSLAFKNSLAFAATHWIAIEAIVVNGVIAGDIDFQMAQNTADALSLTVLRGAFLEVTIT